MISMMMDFVNELFIEGASHQSLIFQCRRDAPPGRLSQGRCHNLYQAHVTLSKNMTGVFKCECCDLNRLFGVLTALEGHAAGWHET